MERGKKRNWWTSLPVDALFHCRQNYTDRRDQSGSHAEVGVEKSEEDFAEASQAGVGVEKLEEGFAEAPGTGLEIPKVEEELVWDLMEEELGAERWMLGL